MVIYMSFTNHEYLANQILRKLHNLLDCIDGLQHIITDCEEHDIQHKVVFKICYEKFYNYLQDAIEAARQLIQIPMFIDYPEKEDKFYKEICNIPSELMQKLPIALEIALCTIHSRIVLPLSNKIHASYIKSLYKKCEPIINDLQL